MKSKLKKYIQSGDYFTAYNLIESANISFDFRSLSSYTEGIDAIQIYRFLMYAISKNETAELHITICNYIFFVKPHFTDEDSLIKWHLVRAFDLSHDIAILKNWIFGVYSGNPDCPFSDKELDYYRKFLFLIE